MNKSSMLLLCGWAKTGRGDGITKSGIAAPFLFPKTNSVKVKKDIAIGAAAQQKYKAVTITTRIPHGRLKSGFPISGSFFWLVISYKQS